MHNIISWFSSVCLNEAERYRGCSVESAVKWSLLYYNKFSTEMHTGDFCLIYLLGGYFSVGTLQQKYGYSACCSDNVWWAKTCRVVRITQPILTSVSSGDPTGRLYGMSSVPHKIHVSKCYYMGSYGPILTIYESSLRTTENCWHWHILLLGIWSRAIGQDHKLTTLLLCQGKKHSNLDDTEKHKGA